MNFLNVVEQRIQEAREQGKFKNLKGEGAPQEIEDNPFENPEMRLAHKVLSNAGFCLPWLELMKEIDADVSRAERVWEDYRAHRRAQMEGVHRGAVARFAETVAEIDAARNRALTRLESRWTEINKKVADLNATVPSESLQRIPVQIAEKRRQFEWDFPLLGGVVSNRR